MQKPGQRVIRCVFIKLLDGYEIKELVRTGIAGLSRGAEVMLDDFD